MEKDDQGVGKMPQIDLTRRRLTRVGLAAPAVLGTLASKRVLGADYYCTTSGQVSGNTSTHGQDVGCVITGTLSLDDWAKQSDNSYSRLGAKFNSLNINGGPSFPNIFFTINNTNGLCNGPRLVSSGTNGQQSTLLEILTLSPSVCETAPSSDLLNFARETIATVLNREKVGSTFPINQQEAMAMFNAVYSGGTLAGSYIDPYWLNKSAAWNITDVTCYFQLLYGKVQGCNGLTT